MMMKQKSKHLLKNWIEVGFSARNTSQSYLNDENEDERESYLHSNPLSGDDTFGADDAKDYYCCCGRHDDDVESGEQIHVHLRGRQGTEMRHLKKRKRD